MNASMSQVNIKFDLFVDGGEHEYDAINTIQWT